MKHTILSLVHRFSTVFALCVLVVAGLLVLLPKFTSVAPFHLYAVESGSMVPTLPVDSIIITRRPQAVADIGSGDIITFEQPGYENRFVTHRVQAIQQEGSRVLFITKGDANAVIDPWEIPFGRIVGIYQTHVPYLGRVTRFIGTPVGFSVTVIFPVILIIAREIRSIFRRLVEKRVRLVIRTMKHTYGSITAQYNRKFRPRVQRPVASPLADNVNIMNVDSVHAPPKRSLIVLVTLGIVGVGLFAFHDTLASFISAKVEIAGNSITTAEVFSTPEPTGEPTPVITPTGTPTPSPQDSPSPPPPEEPSTTPTPCEEDVAISRGNENTGEGSTNENTVHVAVDCDVQVEDSGSASTSITVDADTGGNSSSANTDGDSSVSGDVTVDINVSNEF